MKSERRVSQGTWRCARLLNVGTAFSIGAVCTAIACLATSVASAQSVKVDKIVLSARDTGAHIFSSDRGGTLDSLRLVVRDSATLAKIWEQLDRDFRQSVAPPTVDFATHDVIVASLGSSGVLGPFVVIDTVGVRAKRRTVIVHRFLLASSRCAVTSFAYDAARPTDVVLIPRDSVDVTKFVERVSPLPSCGQSRPGERKPLRRP